MQKLFVGVVAVEHAAHLRGTLFLENHPGVMARVADMHDQGFPVGDGKAYLRPESLRLALLFSPFLLLASLKAVVVETAFADGDAFGMVEEFAEKALVEALEIVGVNSHGKIDVFVRFGNLYGARQRTGVGAGDDEGPYAVCPGAPKHLFEILFVPQVVEMDMGIDNH